MKKILFIRHGSAEIFNYNIKDYDRPLDSKGIKEAEYIGNDLSQNNISPVLYITSPAIRAKNTCEIIRKEINNNSPVMIDKRLYFDGMKGIINSINNIDNNIQFVAMFGHNPTFEIIYNNIKGMNNSKFPTCGSILCKFDVDKWELFSIKGAKILYDNWPKI